MTAQQIEGAIVAATNVVLGIMLLRLDIDHPMLKPWARSRHRRRWGVFFIVIGLVLFVATAAGM